MEQAVTALILRGQVGAGKTLPHPIAWSDQASLRLRAQFMKAKGIEEFAATQASLKTDCLGLSWLTGSRRRGLKREATAAKRKKG